MRITLDFTQKEYLTLFQEAKTYGFTIPAYIKYRSLLPTRKVEDYDLIELFKEQDENLKNICSGSSFIVSSLNKDWVNFSRGTKLTLAKKLSKIVKENPEKYIIDNENTDRRSATVYIKK